MPYGVDDAERTRLLYFAGARFSPPAAELREENQVRKIVEEVSSRHLPVGTLVDHLHTLACIAVRYNVFSHCTSSAPSEISFAPLNIHPANASQPLFSLCSLSSHVASLRSACRSSSSIMPDSQPGAYPSKQAGKTNMQSAPPPGFLLPAAGEVAGSLWRRVPELQASDISPLVDSLAALLLLDQQRLKRQQAHLLRKLVDNSARDSGHESVYTQRESQQCDFTGKREPLFPGEEKDMWTSGRGELYSATWQQELTNSQSNGNDFSKENASGLPDRFWGSLGQQEDPGVQLRLLARVVVERVEELLHLLRLDEVSRAAWNVACVFPPSCVSPFFYFAVNRRMVDAMQVLQTHGMQESYSVRELSPLGDCNTSATSASVVARSPSHRPKAGEAEGKPDPHSVADTVSISVETTNSCSRQQDDRTECGTRGDNRDRTPSTVAALAVALHPFAARELTGRVSFLRNSVTIDLITRLVEETPGGGRFATKHLKMLLNLFHALYTADCVTETLVRYLHLYSGCPQARRLLLAVLTRLDLENSVKLLPPAVFVDVAVAAGSSELPHATTYACIRHLLEHASSMHPHAVAECVLGLAGHLTVEQLLGLAVPLQEQCDLLSTKQHAGLLLLYSQSCMAATTLLKSLESHLLASMETLPVDLFARVALAFAMSTSASLPTINKIADTLQAHVVANNVSSERLIDVTLALAVAGRQKLRCWQAFGISTRIADFCWRSLPTLAWIFAMTDYREVAAWLSIALLIPQCAAELLVVQRAQLYEAFTAARLVGFFDVREQVPDLAARLESWRPFWSRVRASSSGGRSAGNSVGNQSSPVPYDAILHVANISFVRGRATELYPLPFLIPQYNLIFEPLETTPVHYGTGMKLGEVSLRHRVWSAMGFSILTMMSSEFQQFFEHSPSANTDQAATHSQEVASSAQTIRIAMEGGQQFNVGAAAAFLKSKIENVARNASAMGCWLSVIKGGTQSRSQALAQRTPVSEQPRPFPAAVRSHAKTWQHVGEFRRY
ncbi:hypothetical protein CSUI_009187 [Cystoisospora suis]|uniref:Uncharacterized protein n=1 Tax=Cystoisospora suis TaxID=483139 RepID=A0A2C6KKV1_9APIC|nr:hypothetical protein CSUI_009187 [Cystoisospora suis]